MAAVSNKQEISSELTFQVTDNKLMERVMKSLSDSLQTFPRELILEVISFISDKKEEPSKGAWFLRSVKLESKAGKITFLCQQDDHVFYVHGNELVVGNLLHGGVYERWTLPYRGLANVGADQPTRGNFASVDQHKTFYVIERASDSLYLTSFVKNSAGGTLTHGGSAKLNKPDGKNLTLLPSSNFCLSYHFSSHTLIIGTSNSVMIMSAQTFSTIFFHEEKNKFSWNSPYHWGYIGDNRFCVFTSNLVEFLDYPSGRAQTPRVLHPCLLEHRAMAVKTPLGFVVARVSQNDQVWDGSLHMIHEDTTCVDWEGCYKRGDSVLSMCNAGRYLCVLVKKASSELVIEVRDIAWNLEIDRVLTPSKPISTLVGRDDTLLAEVSNASTTELNFVRIK